MDGTEIHNALQTEINCLTVVLRKNAVLDNFTLKCMSSFQSEDPYGSLGHKAGWNTPHSLWSI